MPRREATPAPADQAAAAPEPDVDLSKVHEILEEIDPHGNLIALLQRTPGRLRLPAGAGSRRDRPAQPAFLPRASTASSQFYAQFPPSPPAGTSPRLPRHRLPRGRCDAQSPRPWSRSFWSPTARRAPTRVHAGFGRLHGRLLSGARHAHRRRDLRRSERRRDAQGRAQAARAGRGGTGRWLRCLKVAVPAEGVKVEVSAAADGRAPGVGLRRHRLRVRRLPDDPRRLRRRDRRGRPRGPGRGQHHRLSRPLLPGTAGGRVR